MRPYRGSDRSRPTRDCSTDEPATDERAFTPVAGTGLLVGVVVLVVAVVGAAMFGFIEGVAPPDAEFTIESQNGDLEIMHVGTDPVPAESLHVHGTDPDETVQFGSWPGDGIVHPGDSITVGEATGNEAIEVVWNPVGFDRSKTLGEYDPDEAAIEGWDTEGLGEGLGDGMQP